MIEYHAWITVRYHPHDTNTELQSECWQKILTTCDFDQFSGKSTDPSNGSHLIHYWGSHNRLANRPIVEIFERIAAIAPGSFGSLHIWDDEHVSRSNEFQRYYMVRGVVSYEIDNKLSPCIPMIEDTYDESRDD